MQQNIFFTHLAQQLNGNLFGIQNFVIKLKKDRHRPLLLSSLFHGRLVYNYP